MSQTMTDTPTIDAARARAAAGDLAGADAIFRTLYNPAAPDARLLIAWSRVRRQAADARGAMAMLQQAERAGGGGAAALEMASLLLDLGRSEQATPLLQQAAASGRGAGLEYELARWEALHGRFDQAAARFRALVKAEPRHVLARLGYARVTRDAGRLAEAEAAYVALLNRVPDHQGALDELGHVYAAQRKFAEACATYERLARTGVDVTRPLSQIALGLMHMCDWSQRDALLRSLAARMARPEPCVTDTYALLAGVDDPGLHRMMAERFAGALRAVSDGRARPAARGVSDAGRRLRVGYVSGDFYQHATSLRLAGVIEAHDRSRFELFAYDHSPEDGSATRARMRTAFEHFVSIEQDGPAAAAARIAADEIDVLVDLKGYTERSRSEIFVLRPAPVQVSFLGYAGTQGADWIDYVIADETVLPAAEYANWTETPALMPASYYPDDRGRPAAAADTDRAAQGLPETGIVFCCFNAAFKISPEIFAVWLGLLRDVPGSVLWLYEGNGFVAAQLRRAAGDLADRLVFAKPASLEAHLARHGCADVFLDTGPYGAHTTAADALWAGVPVVTWLGRSFASRVGASLVRAAGCPELACESLEDYAALARALAGDAGRREALRDRLIAARETSTLFDAKAYACALERAFVAMADRVRAGEPPALIRA